MVAINWHPILLESPTRTEMLCPSGCGVRNIENSEKVHHFFVEV
jgi:hypothetical protein